MKVAIISGGSSGIGLACVNKFIQNGYFVYNFDIINNQNSFPNYQFISVDVRNHKAIKDAINQVTKMHLKIDVLVISAGRHLSANIENTSDDQLNDLIDLNLKGAFWLMQEIIPYMKNQLNGSIITIGSDQSSVAKHNSSVYGLTKAALLSLTKSIALDYAKYNIRANCIGAGTIDTPLYRNAINKYAEKTGISISQIERDEALEQPLNRIGTPDEIAELTYFLAQDSSSFITGALIPVDGGYTAK